ncbi:MAG: BON domain-containing protein, partial [Legionellales bacterium]
PDKVLKAPGCSLDIAVFNGDVLIAGHLPTEELMRLALHRLSPVSDYRRIFKQIVLSNQSSSSTEDAWITTRIRSDIFTDGGIDASAFKIITSDRIVYIMGDVRSDQAEKVISMSRQVAGVLRVVKLMKYFTYQNT